MSRRRVIAVLASFLLLVALIEGGLRMFDPLGARRYFEDYNRYIYVHRARGYVMLPGRYQFSNWVATILPDTSRAVPDTNVTAPCTLVLMGDSVTFGQGVSDGDTWANIVARELPGVHIINAGVAGYNIEYIARSIEAFPAQGYLYLFIDNDDKPPTRLAPAEPYEVRPLSDPYFVTYIQVFALFNEPPYTPYLAFNSTLAKLAGSDRVEIVAFDRPGLAQRVAKQYPKVRLIQMYKNRISFSDSHADAAGNRQIAASMLPIIREFTARVCG